MLKFRAGDVVVHRSLREGERRPMTVECNGPLPGHVVVAWFEGDTLHRADFENDDLDLVQAS